jgi:hypothetical protein
MDALTFLREDHKSVLGMLEVLDGASTGSGAQRSGLQTMVTNLVIAESQHEAIEEQFFWPAVREALDNGDELADEAVAQEQEGKRLLQRLHDGEPGDPDYTTRCRNSSSWGASTSCTSRKWCGRRSKRRSVARIERRSAISWRQARK